MGISQYRIAKSISVPQRRISETVHGKRSVTADTALRLGRFFGMEAQFWLNLQSRCDLQRAEIELDERLDKEVKPARHSFLVEGLDQYPSALTRRKLETTEATAARMLNKPGKRGLSPILFPFPSKHRPTETSSNGGDSGFGWFWFLNMARPGRAPILLI